MRKRKTALTCFLVLTLVAGYVWTPVTKAATSVNPAGTATLTGTVQKGEDLEEKLKKELEEAEKKKKEIENKSNELKKKLNNLQSTSDDITQYIEEMDIKQSEMMLEIEEMEAAIEELNAELEITNQQLAVAQENERVQYEALKRRFQYLYEHGNLTDLEVLLGSRDLSDILNYEQYATSIRVYDYMLARKYADARHDVELVKERLESQISVMEASRALYDEDMAYVQQVIITKSEKLEEYAEMIGVTEDDLQNYSELLSSATGDVNELKEKIRKEQERKAAEEARRRAEEAKRLAEEEKKRQQAAAQQSSEERAKKYANVPHTGVSSVSDLTLKNVKDPSKMIWPLPGVSRTGSGFGPRRAPIKGASTFHNGVDIGSPYGVQIVAALAGTVKFAGYNSSGGNYIEIDHGNGYVTKYLHCSKLLVSKGDTVMQGQVIGLVGSTGISTAPHLHFAVYIDGVAVDPLLYVRY